jgi:flagellar basal body P-ring formation protein FlgA
MTVYRRLPRLVLLALCVTPFTPDVRADDGLQSLPDLQRLAAAHLRGQLGAPVPGITTDVTTNELDPRLRLARCPQAPVPFLPQGARVAAKTLVGVRCDARGWTVYVTAGVETEMPVLVLKSAAARDARIGEGDVEVQRRRMAGFAAGYLTRPDELTGRHLRQAAAPGTVLTAELMANDLLVRRGQRVTLIAGVGGIEVRAPGEAMSDATPAGRVRVQNLNSRRVVEGQVESADRVRVNP